MSRFDTLDLFAGPGGWSVAGSMLGLTERGIEWNADACATARAAGFDRLQADIAALDPYIAWREACDGIIRALRVLIGSPPCQGFSTAGKGKGRAGKPIILDGVARIAAGFDPRAVCADVDEQLDDPTAALVLEPLRWALDLEPETIALEQVPTVLPLWQAIADVLRADGYSVWTGNVTAEQYDVPQTRRRAILLASRTRTITGPPRPVRRKYRKGVAQYEASGLLDDGLRPWVSMAQALGWGMTERPSMTVCAGGTDTGGAEPFGNGARQSILREREAGRWTLRVGNRERSTEREITEPAPTLHFGGRVNAVDWVQRSNYSDSSSGGRTAEERGRTERTLDAPSVTVTSKGFAWAERVADQSGSPVDLAWPSERPSTTVAGRELVQHPGATANRFNGATKSRNDGIRVTIEEAATLQSFPDGYPWQGVTKGARYRQVGDAVPPLLGAHMLAHALGVDLGGSLLTMEGEQ